MSGPTIDRAIGGVLTVLALLCRLFGGLNCLVSAGRCIRAVTQKRRATVRLAEKVSAKAAQAVGKGNAQWLVAILFLVLTGAAAAANNFELIRLPSGVTVELPRNWSVFSNNRRITLDSWVQVQEESRGAVAGTSDLAFAANLYDDLGQTTGIFNIRYYPNLDIPQSTARGAGPEDVSEIDATVRQSIVPGIEMAGGRLLAWLGTQKRTVNGAIVFVTEYRRASQKGGNFRARLVRVFNGNKSFTITISYREDEGYFLRPICDRIIGSIRI